MSVGEVLHNFGLKEDLQTSFLSAPCSPSPNLGVGFLCNDKITRRLLKLEISYFYTC